MQLPQTIDGTTLHGCKTRTTTKINELAKIECFSKMDENTSKREIFGPKKKNFERWEKIEKQCMTRHYDVSIRTEQDGQWTQKESSNIG